MNRPSRSLARAAALVAVCALGASLASCGSTFEKSSAVRSLRVLAVQKDQPYAKPGATVKLSMLWWDGKSPVDGPARPVQIAWFGGCEDPVGDLYYACYPQLGEKLASLASSGGAAGASKYVGLGDSFQWTLASDLISRRPTNAGAAAPYGLSYVFFAACAGKLGAAAPDDQAANALPLACLDANGAPLGPDDFVPGFTALYAYETLTNANPIVTGLAFDGTLVPDDDASAPHVPRCATTDCPTHGLHAGIDPASAEPDPGATTPDGTQLTEQVWVDYYATDGDIASAARLVNDATQGWNEEHGTDWTVPRDPGPVLLWAVVHDNRGGVAWLRRRVVVD